MAKELLHWEPSDEHVERVLCLAVAPSYYAAVLGRVYRDRFASV